MLFGLCSSRNNRLPCCFLLIDSVKIRTCTFCALIPGYIGHWNKICFTHLHLSCTVCITLKEKLDMEQNPCTFGTHQDAIAGDVQQKSCRIWNVGGYRPGSPLLHAGISMTKISKTLQLAGGFKGGYNWITNPNNAPTVGKSLKSTVHLLCLIPPQMGTLMTPVSTRIEINSQIGSFPQVGVIKHIKKTPLSLHPAPVLSKSLVLKKATLSSSFVFPLITMLLLCPTSFLRI